jgi:hypothetical protein
MNSEPRGDSPLGGVAPSALWVYVLCAGCGQRIKEPFSRMSGPVVHTHRYQGHDQVCRVVVVPDRTGSAHRVIVVPREVRLEDALQRELEGRTEASRIARRQGRSEGREP